MTTMSSLRIGTLATILGAGVLAGCSTPPDGMIASQQTIVPMANPGDTGPYSGADWDAARDSAMTSDGGGGD